MDLSDYNTNDLVKNFVALSPSSPLLPTFCSELNKRTITDMTCVFTPARGSVRTPCGKPSVTKYGFCAKHENTNAAKKMKARFEEHLTEVVESSEDEDYVPPQNESSSEDDEEEEESSTPEENEVSEVEEDDDESPEENEVSEEESSSEEENEVEDDASSSSSEESENQTLELVKNQWGNYEETETKIVFDIKKSMAYGVQHPNGRVYPLGKAEIKHCVLNNWPYKHR